VSHPCAIVVAVVDHAGWQHGRWASFDLETTGVEPTQARVVTACLVVETADGLDAHDWLLDPGVEIPDGATQIHGITTAHARTHGAPAALAVGEIAAAVRSVWAAGIPLVVYNAPYDLTLLQAELGRHGHPTLSVGPVLDPLVLWRHAERFRPGKKRLCDAAVRFGVDPGQAHSSRGDAVAALGVMRAIATTWPFGSRTLASLTGSQAVWHEQWARGFASWLEDQGEDGSRVGRSWPMAGQERQVG
jgi:DNA polymerase-3 subunit epsilon